MPPVERANRKQYAVLWMCNGYDHKGHPTFEDPREIRVRWETLRSKSIVNYTSADTIKANVVVGERVEMDSVMWLGRLVDISGIRPLPGQEEVMKVARYNETPDVKGRLSRVRRSADLVRYRDAFPSSNGNLVYADLSLSSIEYSQVAAEIPEVITLTIRLVNMDDEPIEGREVFTGLSSTTNINTNNSPQETDEDGIAILLVGASTALTVSATPYTNEDGPLVTSPTLLTFT
jgi:hypothetical protein